MFIKPGNKKESVPIFIKINENNPKYPNNVIPRCNKM